MSKFSLSPDDLPPREATGLDGVMRRQLEDAASSFFMPRAIALLKSCYLVVSGT